jgi:hypothetical protein
MKAAGKAGADYGARINRKTGLRGRARPGGYYNIVCRDSKGNIKWEEEIHNLIVNEGLDHLLDVTLSGATQITTWYIGLTDGTPTVAAGDTMSSHTGWAEVTAYDESVRQTWTEAGVSSQSITNSASVATFTCSTNSTTVGGAFLASNSTKSGTTGILYSAGAFSGGDKSLDDGDTIDITATFTMADDGV